MNQQATQSLFGDFSSQIPTVAVSVFVIFLIKWLQGLILSKWRKRRRRLRQIEGPLNVNVTISCKGVLTVSWSTNHSDNDFVPSTEGPGVFEIRLGCSTIFKGALRAPHMRRSLLEICETIFDGATHPVRVRQIFASGSHTRWSDEVPLTLPEGFYCTLLGFPVETSTVTERERKQRIVTAAGSGCVSAMLLIESNHENRSYDLRKKGVALLAARMGSLNCLTFFLDLDKDILVQDRDPNGGTVTHELAYCGQLECLNMIIGVMPESLLLKNESGDLPLHLAALRGHHDCVDLLTHLATSPTFNRAVNRFGNTPLHYAAWKGHYASVKLLCDVSPDSIGLRNKCGDTAMHLASLRGHVDCISLLGDLQAEMLEGRNVFGDSVLHLAVAKGHSNAVKLLVKMCPASLLLQNERGNTPAHVAAETARRGILELLHHEGDFSSLLVPNRAGDTPLHTAVTRENKACALFMLQTPVGPQALNTKNKFGKTPKELARVSSSRGMHDILS